MIAKKIYYALVKIIIFFKTDFSKTNSSYFKYTLNFFFFVQKEIEEALKNVCNILPSSIKSECDDFIEEYTPEIIKLLEEKLQPESLCKQIGLCSTVKVCFIKLLSKIWHCILRYLDTLFKKINFTVNYN